MRRRDFLRGTAAASTVGVAGLAGCTGDDGEFPSQDLTWVVPWSEGGGSDTYARQAVQPMEEYLDQSIVVENRPGATSLVGTGHLHGSEPDGYTFGTLTPPASTLAWLVQQPDWEMLDLEPIGFQGQYSYTIIANEEHGVEDFEDLKSRYNAGEFETFGYQGIGGASHVISILLQDEEFGVDIDRLVAYDGGGPTSQAVIQDEVPAGIVTTTSAIGATEGDDAEVVANLASEPAAAFPEVDPITEFGYPNIDYASVFTLGLYAPPETPRDVRETLTEALEFAVEHDDYVEWSEETGNEIAYGGIDEAEEVLQDGIELVEQNIDIDEFRQQAQGE